MGRMTGVVVVRTGVTVVVRRDGTRMGCMIRVPVVGTGVTVAVRRDSTCMGCMIRVTVVGTGFGSVGAVSLFSGTAKWLGLRETYPNGAGAASPGVLDMTTARATRVE